MKIPENIRIGGVDYTVCNDVPGLNDGMNLLYGEINYRNSTISITEMVDHQMKCITLLHEILHGIIYHSCLEIENEEKVVEVIAKGIYQVLQDNGSGLFDIVSDSNA